MDEFRTYDKTPQNTPTTGMTCVPKSSKLAYDKAVNMTFGKLHFKIRNSFNFIIN
jgi:hypothetical protein